MAPAGPVRREDFERGVRVLESWGFRVEAADNVFDRQGYLAGADASRLAGVGDLLDRGVEALIALRGGYGCGRLLPEMPWQRLLEWRGWVVGFSDLTTLHCALAAREFPVATLHGPMVAGLGRDRMSDGRLRRWLTGRSANPLFRFSPARVVRGGVAQGVAVGGNLALLTSLLGSPYEPPWDDAVLFLEEVGEPLYRLDRMLTQLRLASRLAGVNAVVSGRLEACGRGEFQVRRRWREMLEESIPGAVIVDGMAFGHGRRNLAFPLGVNVTVDADSGWIRVSGEGGEA